MTSERPNGPGGSRRAKRTRATELQIEPDRGRTSIEIERTGDWMPAEEFRDAALGALEAGKDVTVNVGNVDHLDASALQILLALNAEQKKRGGHLQLVNASPKLLRWFEFSGATDYLFPAGVEAR